MSAWPAMARQTRIEYAGAACHVMARGNQGRRIYADDADRERWRETVGEACAKTGWRIRTKGMAEKQVLAWWPRQRTTVGRRWVSEGLGWGTRRGFRGPPGWFRPGALRSWKGQAGTKQLNETLTTDGHR